MQGNEILAANALLMQLFTLFSFFMDGFAFSAEAICGKYSGAGQHQALKQACRLLISTSATLALIFTAGYATLGTALLEILCDDLSTLAAAREYEVWAISIPLAGFMAFVCDGIFIGLTATRSMLLSMLCATAVYFTVYMLARGRQCTITACGWPFYAIWPCADYCSHCCLPKDHAEK